MNAAVQTAVVDAVVAAAALWLVWSFGPSGWRARFTRRKSAPSYDRALQADRIDGRAPREDCGPESGDCGCG